jgi:hypothetical protein
MEEIFDCLYEFYARNLGTWQGTLQREDRGLLRIVAAGKAEADQDLLATVE